MSTEILNYSSGKISAKLERSSKILLSDVRFSVSSGESVALIGETGSGKTMAALSIMGLLPTNVTMLDSRIIFCRREADPNFMKKLLGVELVYIPQNGAEFLNPSRKIKDHLFDSLRKLGCRRSEMHSHAVSALRVSGFEHPESIMEKYPFQLSGGMAQRVTIAISACSNAKLIIADEPTNGLDQSSKQSFKSRLDRIFPEAGKLIITHDISVAALCERVIVLCGGRMSESGYTAELFSNPHHPYTQALISALVENGLNETPLLRTERGRCPFYRRCPKALPECLTRICVQTDGASEWWCNFK